MGTSLFYRTGQYGTSQNLTTRHFSLIFLYSPNPTTARSAVLQNSFDQSSSLSSATTIFDVLENSLDLSSSLLER